MFHTIISLSYTIPSIYLFTRFWQFYIEKKQRLRFFIVFVILFSLYPLSSLINDNEAGAFGEILSSASNYLLPYFLYLFLCIMVTDILLLINRGIKIIPREIVRAGTFRNRMLIVILSLPAIVLIAGIINFNTIRVSEYHIDVPGKFSDLKNLRIAFVSDFHLEEKTSVEFVNRFVKKIETVKPDLLLYGGDIVEGFSSPGNMESFETLLMSVKPKFGVFGVPGNHDRLTRSDTSNFFTRSGIRLLRDSIISVGRSFTLAGRNDARETTRMSASELLNKAPENLPVIVMDHRPTEPGPLSLTPADIVFSGHTHHGQLFPINLITSSVYELSRGYMKKEKTHFFVSSGIRLWGPHVRTAGKSEILVVNIKFVN